MASRVKRDMAAKAGFCDRVPLVRGCAKPFDRVFTVARRRLVRKQQRCHAKEPTPVITIEPRSGTWESLARACKKLSIEPQMRLESFFAVAQLAAQGFGHGLVPLGVARALGVEESSRLVAGLTRPVQVVGRATTLARPAVREFVEALKQARL
jgi:DNA-binding transcriptional LysR family regulator